MFRVNSKIDIQCSKIVWYYEQRKEEKLWRGRVVILQVKAINI